MKNDIKKKFIDILFEPEEDEEEEVYVRPKAEPKPVKKLENAVKAKDILYRKPERSAFIDLEEKKKKEEKKEPVNVYGDYEFSSQISPIFGVIKESKPEVKSSSSASVNEALFSKPDSSRLEIITSPIYGYGKREDFEKEHPDLFADHPFSDEEELHMLIDDDYAYDSHTYDDIEEDNEEINLFNSYGEEE